MLLYSIAFRYKKPIQEIKEVEEPKVLKDAQVIHGAIPKKVEWKAGFLAYQSGEFKK